MDFQANDPNSFRVNTLLVEFSAYMINVHIVKVHLEGVNRCMANLMRNNAELKTNCNTLSVTKECS